MPGGPVEVAAAQQEIFKRVIELTGETLEASEFDGAYQRLRATMGTLIERYRLQLDPADIPNLVDEAMARMRENRRKPCQAHAA